MQFYGVVTLFVALSVADGLRCYTCKTTSCTNIMLCPEMLNRCFSTKVGGYNVVAKGCLSSIACMGSTSCCEGDLCNSALPTGPSVILLLVSSAILTHFL